MDRVIQVFVFDRYRTPINGADIRFFADGALLGTAKSSSGRASIQVEDPDLAVTIDVTFEGQVKKATLATGQSHYDFTFDVVVKEPFFRAYFPALLGVSLLAAGVLLAFGLRPLQPFEKQLVMILMALGGGGVASVIPGFLNIRLTFGQRLVLAGGGAIAVFVLLFFFEPAIVSSTTEMPTATE